MGEYRKARYGLFVRPFSIGNTHNRESMTLSLLSWLLDYGLLSEKETLRYFNRKGTVCLFEGTVFRHGIIWHRRSWERPDMRDLAEITHRDDDPFVDVYQTSGWSWSFCLLKAWEKEEKPRKFGKNYIRFQNDDPNDDVCCCGFAGFLICCNGCPSAFHPDCVGLENVPEGQWYCPYCVCGICKSRIVEGSSEEAIAERVLWKPYEMNYHRECLSQFRSKISGSFCTPDCDVVIGLLEKLLFIKNDLEGGLSWNIVRLFDDRQLNSLNTNRTLAQMSKCNAILAVAYSLMDESFFPIVDPKTKIDILSSLVFGLRCDLPRLNFGGFYTVVLREKEEFVSAASIRIHGSCLAEMPLIATRPHRRRQGMCRRLVNAIKEMLQELHIAKIVIPTIPELQAMWTTKFGFRTLTDQERYEIISANVVAFPGTAFLQKDISQA